MSKRLLALVYLVFLYIVMSTIVKYIFKSFVIFCVVYTLQDCYKKRRRFMWVFYMVKNNVQMVTYALVGDELYNDWYCVLTRPRNFQKKLKKKI
jgi:hypothetical protein